MSDFSDLLLSLNPSLYWPLDAVDGATDQSGNGRDGTGAGGISIGGHTGTFPPILGADESCTEFDNTDDIITSTYAAYVNGTTRTFLGWAFRDGAGSLDGMIHSTGASGRTCLTFTNDSNEFRFKADDSVGSSVVVGTWPGNAEWVFWGIKFDEANDLVTAYLNGVAGTPVAHATAYDSIVGNFQAGGDGETAGADLWYDGKQAHLAVFETGLTDQNFADLYDAAINGVGAFPLISQRPERPIIP